MTSPMARYRVLVVDDQHEVRRMLATSLKSLGGDFDVLEVPSGEEALLISSRLPLDLVVADVRLPGMSGLELVARLQKRGAKVKTILVTGMEEPRIRRQVAEAGADAFFYKPVEMADFLDAVERILGMVEEAFPLPPIAEEPVKSKVAAREPITRPITSGGLPLEEPSQPTLSGRLSALCNQLKALGAILLDDSGRVMAETGDLADIQTAPSLLSSLIAVFTASLRVSHDLGIVMPDSLLYFPGAKYHLYMIPVGQTSALVVVVQEDLRHERLGSYSRVIAPVVHELQQMLESMGIPVEPPRGVPAKTEAELALEAPVDPEVLASVDALFQQAAQQPAKQADADAFWDDLVERSELDGSSNADALSYDQAQRMGLAPGEEE